MAVVAFLAGLGLLLGGGELVVRGGSALGRRMGLSTLAVGLTIVSLGTSGPELAVGVQAARGGDADLALGNVVGSNIANVLLVLGLGAALGSLPVASRVIRTDIPVMAVLSLAVYGLALDGWLGRPEGVLLVVGLVVYTALVLRAARREPQGGVDPDDRVLSMPVGFALLAIGVGGLVLGSDLVVGAASEMASSLGVSELVIGLTVVAVGTSSPELVTTVVALRRGERDLAVGNAVGSCILNLLAVLGVTLVLAPDDVAVSEALRTFDLPVMVAAAFAAFPLAVRGERIERWEGVVMLLYYAAYVTYVVLDAVEHVRRDPFSAVVLGFLLPLTVITFGALLVRDRRAVWATVRDSGHGAA